jgi:hypothetical protein
MKKYLLTLAFISYTCLVGNAQNYMLQFNGNTSNIDAGSTIGNSVRTIEFWFKPSINITSSATDDGYTLLARNDAFQNAEYGVYIRGYDWNSVGHVGRLAFFMRDNGLLHEVFSNANTWVANTWYHFAGTIDASNGMKLYINGILQTNTDPSGNAAVMTHPSSTSIGCWGDAYIRYFNGYLDELRFWNRALTQPEIQTKMCTYINPANEIGLTSYLILNEGAGIQTLNLISNSSYFLNNTNWVPANNCIVESLREIQKVEKQLIVSPNPSTGLLNIKLENTQDKSYTIEVFDVYGKLIYKDEVFNITGSEFNTEINLSNLNLSNGLYLINVISENQKSSQRIVIEK